MIEAAVSLSVSLSTRERRAAFEQFFAAYAGSARPQPGYGRALIDFLEWEIDSGRVVDAGGSPWWKCVNGLFALDLRRAMALQAEPPVVAVDAVTAVTAVAEPAVLAWLRYSSAPPGDEQAALWHAHEESIANGVHHAAALLEEETAAEQSFVQLMLRVLGRATRDSQPTDTAGLDAVVRRLYPDHYPIAQEELGDLTAALRSPQPGAPRPTPPA